MRAANPWWSLALLALLVTGCSHRNNSTPPQAQAPPLQTGKGTLSPPQTAQQQDKNASPLASPLPPPSAQSVPLPPPPPPKKVRHRVKKPADTGQSNTAAAAAPPATSAQAQVSPMETPTVGTPSPIGQLTTGDGAMEEKTKQETVNLIGGTQQGLAGIKRTLSSDETVTVEKIHTFLKQAQQALDNGDTEGAHGLAIKAKQLLDELIKP